MIVIRSSRLLKLLLPWFPGVTGLTLFPFIILREDIRGTEEEHLTLNHERIHIRQQIELLIVPFAIWYLSSFLAGILRGKGLEGAYRDIIFEREAFDRMFDADYLKRRPLFAFMQYRRRKGGRRA